MHIVQINSKTWCSYKISNDILIAQFKSQNILTLESKITGTLDFMYFVQIIPKSNLHPDLERQCQFILLMILNTINLIEKFFIASSIRL